MIFVQRGKFIKSIYGIESARYKFNEAFDPFIRGQFYEQGLTHKEITDFECLLLVHAKDGYIYIIPYENGDDAGKDWNYVIGHHELTVDRDTLVLKCLDKYKEDCFELA